MGLTGHFTPDEDHLEEAWLFNWDETRRGDAPQGHLSATLEVYTDPGGLV